MHAYTHMRAHTQAFIHTTVSTICNCEYNDVIIIVQCIVFECQYTININQVIITDTVILPEETSTPRGETKCCISCKFGVCYHASILCDRYTTSITAYKSHLLEEHLYVHNMV